jgi:hypothetical protein
MADFALQSYLRGHGATLVAPLPYGRVNFTVTVVTTAVGTPFNRDG